MIPPAELDDTKLHAKLQEVLCALAAIRCLLHDTDHLSDRELYTWLWSDGLREEMPDLSQLGGTWHMSPIGSGANEDIAIFLKYYASTAPLECRFFERSVAAALRLALSPGSESDTSGVTPH